MPWKPALARQLTPGAVPVPPGRETAVALQFIKLTDASAATTDFARATSVRGNTNLRLTLQLDALWGWTGATVHAQHFWLAGRDGSRDARIVQSVSNIEGTGFHSVGELWLEQRLLADRVRLKVGRLDFNHEFAVVEHGSAFLNGSMGFSPSIAAGPSFPITTPGVNVFVTPVAKTTIRLGAYDGQSGAPAGGGRRSRFFIAELGRQWGEGTDRPGRISAGGWRHTGRFAVRASRAAARPDSQGTHGWHATLDQRLWQRARRSLGRQPSTVAAFLQIGAADRRVRTVHRHLGGGLTLLAPSARRHRDLIGVGVTLADWQGGFEHIAESFYSLAVGDHVAFIFDVQGVTRRESRGDRVSRGVVASLRSAIGF